MPLKYRFPTVTYEFGVAYKHFKARNYRKCLLFENLTASGFTAV